MICSNTSNILRSVIDENFSQVINDVDYFALCIKYFPCSRLGFF
jgi:hypothetical protein